ncbi:low temperature requirement protein A [Candidatus Gracilibacteria bacterium]|nr:low temperature requirement protein A [Candidatus Gracilibacteria bacterium]
MRKLLPKIHPRHPSEENRGATPLELFFDLAFVVAIASAGSNLHHAISAGHALSGLFSFSLVFFAIWWAWMGFTWFASAYDNDNNIYRLLVFVQITGALILAAGVTQAFTTLDFEIMVTGYVVMRLPLVFQWLRVAAHDQKRRKTALRYASGLTLAQVIWVALMFLPVNTAIILGIPVIALELAIPIWAEKSGRTPWNLEHIKERYGLFTIIVLGESILAASIAIEAVSSYNGNMMELILIIVGGLIILFSLWWLYFVHPDHDHFSNFNSGILWGYGHLFIYGSAAAIGSGIAVAVDFATNNTSISPLTANLAITIPVSIFVLSVWLIHIISAHHKLKFLLFIPSIVTLILLSSFSENSIFITGLILLTIMAITSTDRGRELF